MPLSAAQLTTDYGNANLGITPSASDASLIQSYAQANGGGALTDAQALSAVLALSSDKTDVAVMTYQFFTGSTPSLAGLAFLVHGGGNPDDLSSAYYAAFNQENRYYNFAINLAFGSGSAAAFAVVYGAFSLTQIVQTAYEQIVSSAVVGAAHAAAAEAFFQSNIAFYQQVAAERAGGLNQDLATKAIIIGSILNEAVKADVGAYVESLDQFMTSLGTTGSARTGNMLVNYPPIVDTTTVLTAAADTLSLGAGNDTVTGTALTFNAADNLNGGGGTNVLTVSDTGALALSGETVANFQTVSLSSGGALTVDAATVTGATQMNLTAGAGMSAKHIAATTNVSAVDAGSGGHADYIEGGGVVSVSAGANSVTVAGAAGAVTITNAGAAISVTSVAADVTVTAAGDRTIAVQSGANISVNETGNDGGAIRVGDSTHDATGAVTIDDSLKANARSGAVAIHGGESQSVILAASPALGDFNIFGDLSLYGSKATTSVTVSETSPSSVAGILVDGAVLIQDANGASAANGAGTIAAISLSNVHTAVIEDNALASLSLTGDTASGGVTLTDYLGSNGITTLSLSLNGFKGAFDDSQGELTTINVTTSGAGSTISQLTDAVLTNLSVSGAGGGLTVSSALQVSLRSLSVSGAASFSGDISNTALAAFAPTTTGAVTVILDPMRQSFTGGSSTDTVTLGADLANGHTITGGSGSDDTLVLTNTAATYAHLAGIAGFETLAVDAAATGAFDLSNFTNEVFSAIDVRGSAGALTFQNVAPGTALSLDQDLGGSVIYSTSDNTGATDQMVLTLGSTTLNGATAIPPGSQLVLEDSVLSGIGVVTMNSLARSTGGPFINSIATLSDNGLKSLTFTGDAGVSIGSLGDNAASVTIVNGSNAGVLDTLTSWTDNALKSLTVQGQVALSLSDSLTTGVTIDASTDNASITLALSSVDQGATDTVGLGSGNHSVAVSGAGALVVTTGDGNDVITHSGVGSATITAGDGSNSIDLRTNQGLDRVTVGTGANTVKTGIGGSAVSIGASGAHNESVITQGAGNVISFGVHTTGADQVTVTANGGAVSAVISGLNSSPASNDTITFTGDGSATGAVVVVTTVQINTYAAQNQLDPTQLTTAIAAVLDTLPDGGAALAQHGVGVFQFQGNTYIVEQANPSGTALNAADTVVELVGTPALTAANSTAAAGVLALHG